ncbi:MAG: recombinase RecA [Christensenellaceae bacterium]|jgi:recombination protein RecA|nr:recombinase RecA [Christensenellaceae bacterium]
MDDTTKKGKVAPDNKGEPTTEERKKRALAEVLAKIEKEFGKGAIMNLNSKDKLAVDVIPTGCLPLDQALGIGGLPRGRIIEIYGPESSGKTTIALHVIAEAQKMGGIAAFIDAEHALDPVYAEKLGVDISCLYVAQPDNGEQGLDIAEELVKSGSMDIIVIDSVAALTPKAEIEGDMGDSHIGLQARLMSQALRKMTAVINRTNTCVIFINQLRDKVGVIFGSPETTSGGKALKFYASIRLDVRKADGLKDSGVAIGTRTRIKVVKNKLAPPFRQAEFDMLYGQGVSVYGCLLDMGVEKGLIIKSGSWFSYKDEKIGQGRDKAIDFIKNNPEVSKELDAKIRAEF